MANPFSPLYGSGTKKSDVVDLSKIIEEMRILGRQTKPKPKAVPKLITNPRPLMQPKIKRGTTQLSGLAEYKKPILIISLILLVLLVIFVLYKQQKQKETIAALSRKIKRLKKAK